MHPFQLDQVHPAERPITDDPDGSDSTSDPPAQDWAPTPVELVEPALSNPSSVFTTELGGGRFTSALHGSLQSLVERSIAQQCPPAFPYPELPFSSKSPWMNTSWLLLNTRTRSLPGYHSSLQSPLSLSSLCWVSWFSWGSVTMSLGIDNHKPISIHRRWPRGLTGPPRERTTSSEAISLHISSFFCSPISFKVSSFDVSCLATPDNHLCSDCIHHEREVGSIGWRTSRTILHCSRCDRMPEWGRQILIVG